jgi:cation:H+ antiporter
LLLYTFLLIYLGRPAEKPAAPTAASPANPGVTANSVFRDMLRIAAGLTLLVLGSRWLVLGAVSAAKLLGVGETIIGLTIVAAGTSLPEVVTSLVASFRGERDIAVGNVVGSNLFNLLGVLGLAALVAPEAVTVPPAVLARDLPIMVAVAFVCLPIVFTEGTISRWEGGLLLAYYAAYTTYLILMATGHPVSAPFQTAMAYFVIPLTLITLLVVTIQAIRRQPPPPGPGDTV